MEKSDISDSHLIIDEQEPTDVLLNNPSKHLSSDGVNKSSATASRTPRLHARSCTTCYRRKVKCDKVITGCSRCSKAGIPCVFPARNGTQGGDELQGRLKSLEKIVQELLRRNEGEKIEREDHHSAEVPIPSPVESDTSPIVGTNPPTLKKGRLVTIGGRSSYLTSSFWASFNEEVEGLKDLVEGYEDDAESPGSFISEPLEAGSQRPSISSQGFFFNFSSLSRDLQSLMPSPEQVPIYWKTYVTGVDPLLKILHAPSVKDAFMSAQFSLAGLNKASQALIFAICFAAGSSMSSERTKSSFNEDKDVLMRRLRFAVEQALARANFMSTNEIVTLQAMVLFLNCIPRQDDDSRVLCTMTAVAVRLAQLQGLHRDGTLFGLSPFETEMRRRLWWNICTLDRRAAEEQGSAPLIWESSFDTKMPLNINDSDIHVGSTSFPEPRTGATDMSFVLLRVEHWKAYPQFQKLSDLPEKLSQEEAAEYIKEKEKLLEKVKEHFEVTYLRYFDTSVPFFWLLNTFTRQAFEKMALLIYHPFHTIKENALFPQEIRDRLFISCIKIIAYSRIVDTNPFLSQWAWWFRIYVQRNAVAFVLTELCVRPSSEDVDRAWEAIDFVFNWWSPAVKKTTDGVVWRPLKKLLGRALKVRGENLSLKSRQLSDGAVKDEIMRDAPRHDVAVQNKGLQSDSSKSSTPQFLEPNYRYSSPGQAITRPDSAAVSPNAVWNPPTLDFDANFNYGFPECPIPPEDIEKYLHGFNFEGDDEGQSYLGNQYLQY